MWPHLQAPCPPGTRGGRGRAAPASAPGPRRWLAGLPASLSPRWEHPDDKQQKRTLATGRRPRAESGQKVSRTSVECLCSEGSEAPRSVFPVAGGRPPRLRRAERLAGEACLGARRAGGRRPSRKVEVACSPTQALRQFQAWSRVRVGDLSRARKPLTTLPKPSSQGGTDNSVRSP